MSPPPPFRPKPRLGYAASIIERAAGMRADIAALAALQDDSNARAYLIGGEIVALNKTANSHDPLFTLNQAQALGPTGEAVFIGFRHDAPRFARALAPETVEAF